MGYEVVRYSPELRPGVIELLVHAWGDDRARNAAAFAWKFEQNPYLDRPMLHLVLHAGQVVGMRAVHGAHWLAGPSDARLPALGTGDFVIHPAHRGRHLYGRIMKAAAADLRRLGYRYLINLSASPATYLQSIRAGWRDLGPLATLCRASLTARLVRRTHGFIRGLPALAAVSRRGKAGLRLPTELASAARPFRTLESRIDPVSARCGLPLTVAHQARAEAMASLIASGAVRGPVRHVRNATYLAWRFGNPLSIYRFVFCGADDLEAFVVLETPNDPLRNRVRIVLCEATDDVLRRRLISAVMEAGRFNDLRIWSAAVAPTDRDWMGGEGFQPIEASGERRYRHALLVRDLDADAKGDGGLPDIAHWNLSMLDSDKC